MIERGSFQMRRLITIRTALVAILFMFVIAGGGAAFAKGEGGCVVLVNNRLTVCTPGPLPCGPLPCPTVER